MRYLLAFAICFLVTTTLAFGQAANANPPRHSIVPSNPDAVLLFDDEFDGTSLNLDNWYQCYPRSFASWGCDNNDSIDLEWYWKYNVSVSNGILNLTALKQQAHGHNYTSGLITTGGSVLHEEAFFSFLYGYVEMSAQFPPGAGMWPGFWLLPADLTTPGEIDVVEWQGGTPKIDYATVHYVNSNGVYTGDETAFFAGVDMSTGYHTYGVDWEATYITWYFDGKPIKTVTNTEEIPNVPMYVLVDLAVGGWISFPNKNTVFPANMLVDYVQVWSQYPGAH